MILLCSERYNGQSYRHGSDWLGICLEFMESPDYTKEFVRVTADEKLVEIPSRSWVNGSFFERARSTAQHEDIQDDDEEAMVGVYTRRLSIAAYNEHGAKITQFDEEEGSTG